VLSNLEMGFLKQLAECVVYVLNGALLSYYWIKGLWYRNGVKGAELEIPLSYIV